MVEKDRHVLALAVHVGAPTIVTNNLRDFPPELCEPFDVEAISADAFTLAQGHLHRADLFASIDAMAARRQRYPKTRADIIERLRIMLPTAMAELD